MQLGPGAATLPLHSSSRQSALFYSQLETARKRGPTLPMLYGHCPCTPKLQCQKDQQPTKTLSPPQYVAAPQFESAGVVKRSEGTSGELPIPFISWSSARNNYHCCPPTPHALREEAQDATSGATPSSHIHTDKLNVNKCIQVK